MRVGNNSHVTTTTTTMTNDNVKTDTRGMHQLQWCAATNTIQIEETILLAMFPSLSLSLSFVHLRKCIYIYIIYMDIATGPSMCWGGCRLVHTRLVISIHPTLPDPIVLVHFCYRVVVPFSLALFLFHGKSNINRNVCSSS
jgi:hypothetical protein